MTALKTAVQIGEPLWGGEGVSYKASDLLPLCGIPGSTLEHMMTAEWKGEAFEVVEYAQSSSDLFQPKGAFELGSILHYPIDPRIRPEDVAGALVAYPNEDNDGWLFAHCDADWMIDHEYKVLAAVTTAFEAQLDAALSEKDAALYAALEDDSLHLRQAFAVKRRTYDSLAAFREDVKTALLYEMRGRHMGYFHQNPHEAHIHEPLERAITATVPKWNITERATEWGEIREAVEAIAATVETKPVYATRWDLAVKLAAEGRDPVDGYEYCYLQLQRPMELPPESLPDPAWKFDQLADGPIVRGGYTYYDAEQPPGFTVLLWAQRFKRPIPEGTKPGADIGSVAWEAETPYRPGART